MIRAVVFDLDGVVRHFDVRLVADIEKRHGLAPETIEGVAFAKPLITDVTTGRISREQWVSHVGDRIAAPAAAVEWGRQPARVDSDLLRLSDELRRDGLTTAVLTNGTDTIPTEVEELGIAPHFDAIYNSAAIGYAKPDVRAFQHVCDDLGLTGPEVFFTDDSFAKLAGAEALGMTTHHYADVTGLQQALGQAGVRAD